MNPKLETLFDEPERRYLNSEELSLLTQYVSSIPERVKVYRQLRDQEVNLVQPIVDSLKQQTPDLSEAALERSLRNTLLILRYAAMAMLMDDEAFIDDRLKGWLPEIVRAFETQAFDQKLLALLQQRLGQVLTPQQMGLLKPGLDKAQALISNARQPLSGQNTSLVGAL